eukprot:COSAG02_NODE_8591_length_2511_cov_9.911277_2_plen_85_part_00
MEQSTHSSWRFYGETRWEETDEHNRIGQQNDNEVAAATLLQGFRLEFPYARTVATDFLPVLDPSPTFGNHAFRITASINRMNHA